MNHTYNADDFRRLTLQEFPELSDEFADSDGLLHIEMSALAYHAQRAKGAGDWATYRRCMELVDKFWQQPDDKLLNALNVSFLEEIDFVGPRGTTAWQYLPPSLQRGWTEMQRYLENLANSVKKQDY